MDVRLLRKSHADLFVVVVGIIAVSVGRGLLQWGRNNKQPVLTVDSRIVSKRTEINQRHTHEPNDQMTSHTNTVYYITFEVESGDRMEFPSAENSSDYARKGIREGLRFKAPGSKVLSAVCGLPAKSRRGRVIGIMSVYDAYRWQKQMIGLHLPKDVVFLFLQYA